MKVGVILLFFRTIINPLQKLRVTVNGHEVNFKVRDMTDIFLK